MLNIFPSWNELVPKANLPSALSLKLLPDEISPPEARRTLLCNIVLIV